MNKKQKFETFLESLKGNGQDTLLESLKQGFHACYEGVERFEFDKNYDYEFNPVEEDDGRGPNGRLDYVTFKAHVKLNEYFQKKYPDIMKQINDIRENYNIQDPQLYVSGTTDQYSIPYDVEVHDDNAESVGTLNVNNDFIEDVTLKAISSAGYS